MFLTSFRSFSRKHGLVRLEKKSKYNCRSPTVILTLDPNKLAEKRQQPHDIGGLKTFRVDTLLLKQFSPVKNMRMFYESKGLRQSFPPDTKAFLYYFRSPEKPRIAGELRLRVTSNDDPASFESGSDVLRTNGQPWSRPLYGLSFLGKLHPLYEKLREEQLVPDDLDRIMRTLPRVDLKNRRNPILYTLNDTFVVDFSSRLFTLFVVTEQGVESLPFNKTFYDTRKEYFDPPYRGSALARLERSTLSDHKDTRTVVLRFLKIITPVKRAIPRYDNYVCFPKEGELYRKTSDIDRQKNTNVWSINIDESIFSLKLQRGLRLLWEA